MKIIKGFLMVIVVSFILPSTVLAEAGVKSKSSSSIEKPIVKKAKKIAKHKKAKKMKKKKKNKMKKKYSKRSKKKKKNKSKKL